ncbi:MAG: hypothetical protein CMP68_00195 [Flavobacteriales bacterium]|nr:hypothetical protein [Flavobacteriales bacterium]
MSISKNLFSSEGYYIINKIVLKKIGIDSTLILSELIKVEEYSKNTDYDFTVNNLISLSENTTLNKSKIKDAINKLYKLKLIDVIVKKKDVFYVKILHKNISQFILEDYSTKREKQRKRNTNSIIKKKKFKKPNIDELKDYFLKIKAEDESEVMYDFYESKGWKIGKNSMKCWKSSARNWARRSKNDKLNLPDIYDQNFEKEISRNQKKLNEYHNHLKKMGYKPSYSPTSGTTWKIKK